MDNEKLDTYAAEYRHYVYPEEVVDPDTGEVTVRLTEEKVTRTVEVTPEMVDLKLPKKFKFNNGSFITIFQKAILNIAMFGKLTKNEMQLLLYLIGSCGAANSICTDLNRLSEDLGMKKPNVSTALKGLVERNIVVRRDGSRYSKTPLPFELHLDFDQINYDLAYNGKIKHYTEDVRKHPALMQKDGTTPLIEAKTHKEAIDKHSDAKEFMEENITNATDADTPSPKPVDDPRQLSLFD